MHIWKIYHAVGGWIKRAVFVMGKIMYGPMVPPWQKSMDHLSQWDYRPLPIPISGVIVIGKSVWANGLTTMEMNGTDCSQWPQPISISASDVCYLRESTTWLPVFSWIRQQFPEVEFFMLTSSQCGKELGDWCTICAQPLDVLACSIHSWKWDSTYNSNHAMLNCNSLLLSYILKANPKKKHVHNTHPLVSWRGGEEEGLFQQHWIGGGKIFFRICTKKLIIWFTSTRQDGTRPQVSFALELILTSFKFQGICWYIL